MLETPECGHRRMARLVQENRKDIVTHRSILYNHSELKSTSEQKSEAAKDTDLTKVFSCPVCGLQLFSLIHLKYLMLCVF